MTSAWAGYGDDSFDADQAAPSRPRLAIDDDMVIEDVNIQSRRLGQGGYANVFAGTWRGTPVAVKQVHEHLLGQPEENLAPGGPFLQAFADEWRLLKTLRHPFLVQFLGVYEPSGRSPSLVMERMHTTLRRRSQTEPYLKDQAVVRVCGEVLCGLAYLHAKGVLHRDLTTNNVLLTRGQDEPTAKISDLGVAKAMFGDRPESRMHGRGHMTRAPGGLLYMSPESIDMSGRPYNDKHDTFSYGVLVLATCTHREPGCESEPRVERVNAGLRPIPEIHRRRKDLAKMAETHPLRGIVASCLNDEPSQRPSAAQLVQRLETLSPGTPKRNSDQPVDQDENSSTKPAAVEQASYVDQQVITDLREKLKKTEDQMKLARDLKRGAERQLDEMEKKLKVMEQRATTAEEMIRLGQRGGDPSVVPAQTHSQPAYMQGLPQPVQGHPIHSHCHPPWPAPHGQPLQGLREPQLPQHARAPHMQEHPSQAHGQPPLLPSPPQKMPSRPPMGAPLQGPKTTSQPQPHMPGPPHQAIGPPDIGALHLGSQSTNYQPPHLPGQFPQPCAPELPQPGNFHHQHEPRPYPPEVPSHPHRPPPPYAAVPGAHPPQPDAKSVEMAGRLRSLEAENTHLNQQLQSAHQQLVEERKRVERGEQALHNEGQLAAVLRQKISQLQTQLQTVEQERARLMERCKALEERSSELEADLRRRLRASSPHRAGRPAASPAMPPSAVREAPAVQRSSGGGTDARQRRGPSAPYVEGPPGPMMARPATRQTRSATEIRQEFLPTTDSVRRKYTWSEAGNNSC